MKKVLWPAVLMVTLFFMVGDLWANEVRTIDAKSVGKLFKIVEDYCQFKLLNGNDYEKEFCTFLLSRLRDDNIIHIAVNFNQKRIWIIEPQGDFHITVLPKSIWFEDDDTLNELREIFNQLGINFMGRSYKDSNVKAIEFQIDTFVGPMSPRNQVKVKMVVQMVNKNGEVIENIFNKKANLVWD